MGIRFLDEDEALGLAPAVPKQGGRIRFLDEEPAVPAIAPVPVAAPVDSIYGPEMDFGPAGSPPPPERIPLAFVNPTGDGLSEDERRQARAQQMVEDAGFLTGAQIAAYGSLLGSPVRMAARTLAPDWENTKLMDEVLAARRAGVAPESLAGKAGMLSAEVLDFAGAASGGGAFTANPAVLMGGIAAARQVPDAVTDGRKDLETPEEAWKETGKEVAKAATFGAVFKALPFKGFLGGQAGGAAGRVAGVASGTAIKTAAGVGTSTFIDVLDPDGQLRQKIEAEPDPVKRAAVFGEQFAREYAAALPMMLAYQVPAMVKAGQTGKLETKLKDYGLHTDDARRMANAAAQGKSILGMAKGLKLGEDQIKAVAEQFKRQYYGSRSLGAGAGAGTQPGTPAAGAPSTGVLPPAPKPTAGAVVAPSTPSTAASTAAVPNLGTPAVRPPAQAAEQPPVQGAVRADVDWGEALKDESAIPIYRVPVEALKLSKDVPNFKEDADARTGVVRGNELQGSYTEQGTGTLVAWKRINGELEVITGRHRLDLARRTGKKTLPVQVLSEADGFTATDAMVLDSEMNIRDGQGKVKDYANYFRNSSITGKEASGRGLLARDQGRKGFALGRLASDSLYTAYRNNVVAESKAAAIAEAAPGNDELQRVGLDHALRERSASPEDLRQYINAISSIVGQKAGGQQLDMFGSSDTAMNEAKQLGKAARDIQSRLEKERMILSASERIGKATGENKAVLEKYGVKAGDAEAISDRIRTILGEIESWNHWPTDAAKVSTVRQAAGLAPAAGVKPVAVAQAAVVPPVAQPLAAVAPVEQPVELPPVAPPAAPAPKGIRFVDPAPAAKADVPIPYDPKMKIANLDQLPKGSGARYLEIVDGPDGRLVAKQWRRKPVAGAKLVDMTPSAADTPAVKPFDFKGHSRQFVGVQPGDAMMIGDRPGFEFVRVGAADKLIVRNPEGKEVQAYRRQVDGVYAPNGSPRIPAEPPVNPLAAEIRAEMEQRFPGKRMRFSMRPVPQQQDMFGAGAGETPFQRELRLVMESRREGVQVSANVDAIAGRAMQAKAGQILESVRSGAVTEQQAQEQWAKAVSSIRRVSTSMKNRRAAAAPVATEVDLFAAPVQKGPAPGMLFRQKKRDMQDLIDERQPIWHKARYERDEADARDRFNQWEQGTPATWAGEPVLLHPEAPGVVADTRRHADLRARRDRSQELIRRESDRLSQDSSIAPAWRDAWNTVEYSYSLAESPDFDDLAILADSIGVELVPVHTDLFQAAQIDNTIFIGNDLEHGYETLQHEMFHVADEGGSKSAAALVAAVDRKSPAFRGFKAALASIYKDKGLPAPTNLVVAKEIAATVYAAGGDMYEPLMQVGGHSVDIGEAFGGEAGVARVHTLMAGIDDELAVNHIWRQDELRLSVRDPESDAIQQRMQDLYDRAANETDPAKVGALVAEWRGLQAALPPVPGSRAVRRSGGGSGSSEAMAAPASVDTPGYAEAAVPRSAPPVDDPEFTRFPVELPEFVRLARVMHPKGAAPRVMRSLRGDAAGRFRYRPGDGVVGIEFDASIFKLVPDHERAAIQRAALAQAAATMPASDPGFGAAVESIYAGLLADAKDAAMQRNPAYASKVAWHEMGHWIDFVPEKLIRGRGNILGRLKSAKSYFKQMLQDTPDNPNDLITERDRRALRKLAEDAVGPKPPADETADRAAWSEEVSRLYAESVRQTAEDRGLITRADVQGQLEELLRWYNGSDDISYYQAKSSEMYADTFSALMNNPSAVEQRAPLFWKLWHNWLRNKPEAGALLKQIQEDISLARIPDERHRAQMESQMRADETADAIEREMAKRSPQEIKDLILQAVDRRYHPVYRRATAVDKAGKPSGKAAHNAVSDWLYHSNIEAGYMHRMEQQVVAPLREIGAPIEEFNVYLENQHIINNRADIASMGGMNPHAAQQALDAQRARLGDPVIQAMENAVEARWQLRQQYILGELEKAGVLSPALMDHLKVSKWYSTVAAVDTGMDPVDALFKQTFGNDMSSRIHRAVGYLGDAKSPLLATMRKDLSLLRLAKTTQLKLSIGEMLKDFNDPMFRPAEMRFDTARRMPLPVIVENDHVGTIVYVQNGKPQGYYAPRAVVDAVRYETPAAMNTFVQMARHGISYIKALYTSLNYGFWPMNYIRDVKGTVRKLPDMYSRMFGKNAYVQYFPRAHAASKSLANGKPNALALQALDRGIIMMRRDRLDQEEGFDSFQKMMLSMNVSPEHYGMKADNKNWIRQVWRKYLAIGQTLEWETKIAAMLHLDRTQAHIPIDDRNNMIRHIAGSANYMETGTMNWAIDWIFPFFNPAKQYGRSEYKAWEQNPWQTLFKTLKYSVLPKLLKLALTSGGIGAAMFGKEWADEFAAMDAVIPNHDRDRYDAWPIMWADKKQGKVLYFRGVEDEFERSYGSVVQQWIDQRFDWRSIFDYAGGQLPGLNPLISVGMAWRDFATGEQPRDKFGPIVSNDRMLEGGGLEEMAKYTANQLGAGIVVRFSPNDWYNPHATRIEKILRAPIISNTVGRFLRVSNAGWAQKVQRDTKAFNVGEARMHSQVKAIVLEVDARGSLTPEQDRYLRDTPGAGEYYRNKYKEFLLLQHLNPYQMEVFGSRHNQRKLQHLDTSVLDDIDLQSFTP